MKCFYHRTDLDGRGSAALIRLAHPQCEMIGLDYTQGFPWDSITPGETIFIVDFSLKAKEMLELSQKCHLVWMDHHATSILDNLAIGCDPAGLRAFDKSSIELTWEFLHPDEPVPIVVSHLGRHDRWDHTDPDTWRVFYGIRLHNTDPTNSKFWHTVVTNFGGIMAEIMEDGDKIQRYVLSEYADYAHEAAFTIKFEGLNFLAINRGLTGSMIVEHLFDKSIHDAVMLFYFQGDTWRFSMYAATDKKDDIDLKPIAIKWGGGGHTTAAGFRLKEIPLDLKAAIPVVPK